jgi:hypothetical protein
MVIAFNDATLESLVRTAMNKPEGVILVSDALAMTELTLEIDGGRLVDRAYSRLGALKYFTNLTKLVIDGLCRTGNISTTMWISARWPA